MKVIISSFGYKFGTPTDADLLLDARSLRNPFRDRELRALTGEHDLVWKAVTSDPRWDKWLDDGEWSIVEAIGKANALGNKKVTIGVGCTGGRHRSVVAALELSRFVYWNKVAPLNKLKEYEVLVGHRDLNKEGEVQGELRNIKDILASLPAPKKPSKKKMA